MPEQIFLDSALCDFAHLASGYRQDGHMPVGTTSEVNLDGFARF
jgi:hypothetical protein